MTTEPEPARHAGAPTVEAVEMPVPTYWPMVLALAVALLASGLVTNLALSALGLLLLLLALANWVRDLLPGAGHALEPFAPPEARARPVTVTTGAVEQLRAGMPGYRLHVPEKVHPYSAGARGGVVGGIVMVLPALLYGLVSGHGIWFPVNLLTGMVLNLPRLENGQFDIATLEQFHLGWLVLGLLIHAVMSIGLGLLNGVLLPMMPGHPLLWSGLIAPLLWSGAIHGFMGVINPAMAAVVDWPSFVASQVVYGVAVGLVVVRSEKVHAATMGRDPHLQGGAARPPNEGQP